MSVWGSNCWSNICRCQAHIQFLFPWSMEVDSWSCNRSNLGIIPHLVSFEEDFTWKWEDNSFVWWYTLCTIVVGYPSMFLFSHSASIDSLLRRIKCLRWISFRIVSCHFISGPIKAKSQPPLPCILCWLELAFFHKKFGMAQGMEEEYCWLTWQRSVILIFLIFLCHMWFGITRLWIQVIPMIAKQQTQ